MTRRVSLGVCILSRLVLALNTAVYYRIPSFSSTIHCWRGSPDRFLDTWLRSSYLPIHPPLIPFCDTQRQWTTLSHLRESLLPFQHTTLVTNHPLLQALSCLVYGVTVSPKSSFLQDTRSAIRLSLAILNQLEVMSGTVDVPSQRDVGTGENTAIRRRRPSLSKPRPVSSPSISSKFPESHRSRPLTAIGAACKEEEEPSEGVVTRSSSPDISSMPGSLTSAADVNGPANSNGASQKDDANLPKERREPRIRKQPRGAQRPTSLNLSESEFPMVTQDPMRISAHDAGQYKARRRGPQISPALSSSVPSTAPNDVFSERKAESRTDLSWSPEFPEYAIASQPPSQILPAFDPQFGGQYPLPQSYPIHNYGAPETPRGNGPFPYFQPPHFPNPMVGPNPMTAPNPMLPQPRAERPPLSGYDLLAAKLTDDVGGGAPITAMYRRFECINHRVLLSLQDQITVLEENLLDMDEIDSGNRLQAGIPLPASEREERVSNHDFHLSKVRLLGQLAQKLQIYSELTLCSVLHNI